MKNIITTSSVDSRLHSLCAVHLAVDAGAVVVEPRVAVELLAAEAARLARGQVRERVLKTEHVIIS